MQDKSCLSVMTFTGGAAQAGYMNELAVHVQYIHHENPHIY